MHQVDHVVLQARIISASRFREALDSCRALLNKQIALLPLPADWKVSTPDLPSLMGATHTTLPAGTLIACTSGSTGTPKGAQLGPEQLEASYNATHSFLHESFSGRPGPWLLALPAHHIAGIQVILRSLRSGFEPLLASHLAHSTPFTPAGFIDDVAALRRHYPTEHLYTSLVPAQLERIATDRGAVAALTEFTCVLAGGAAVRPALAEQLRAAGVTIVESYGSSETAGGVVYDGRAIPGARVTIEDADERGVGTVVVAGPMVARGYLNVPGFPAFASGSYRTSDIGVFGRDATLRILGRADGAVNSGGYKVLPEEVEDAIHSHVPGVVATVAVGVDYPELGQAVHAVIEFRESGTQVPLADEPVEITREVREALRGAVARHLVPKRAWRVRQIPLIGPGKVDRRGVAELVGRLGQ
ncbi:MAG TPA: AMP-binding protein [Candidatus Corynebacterium gallistercoris]|uniref:AMP-binding protein n=1 Tax=Candidatus Corynebacterium gallistercoris TaxID=2838530 RepID=A0A9D1UR57_9CORY|nr:AMP-binding protein [Candidatus Corynebacterium gallistercoris]